MPYDLLGGWRVNGTQVDRRACERQTPQIRALLLLVTKSAAERDARATRVADRPGSLGLAQGLL
ncbi:MAG: hypothetical protein R3300_12740 [Candidatus Promineifilaceae bacterium]|nr:hypothetical protein [Candidatus Promineifilaceae bacterium]